MEKNFLLHKNLIPLCKRGSEFIYIDIVSNQFYSVRESKTFEDDEYSIAFSY